MTDRGKQVREANRIFYDIAAGVYEAVDGRRDEHLPQWLDDVLADLAKQFGGGTLLDVGSGTGWILRGAGRYFEELIASDISATILHKVPHGSAHLVACEGEAMPFADESIDVVTCFAVLHHIWDPRPLIREVHRVLRPGGLFYSDHDMDTAFMSRFRLPMAVYRRLSDAEKRYRRADNRLTTELYRLSEVHSSGVDASGIIQTMASCGFAEVKPSWHWLGLGALTDTIFGRLGHRGAGRGWAPLFSVTGRKASEAR